MHQPLGFTLHPSLLPPRRDPPVNLVQEPHGEHEQPRDAGQAHGRDGQVLEVLIQHLCGP